MSYQPIKVEFVNPFLDATSAVFRTMLNTELKRGALYLRQGMTLSHEISGIIGLSGKAKGTVLIGMNSDFAIAVTDKLLGEKPDGLTPEVIDAVGELANMVAGGAKTRLEEMRKQKAAAEARLQMFRSLVDKLRAMIDAGQLKVITREGRDRKSVV